MYNNFLIEELVDMLSENNSTFQKCCMTLFMQKKSENAMEVKMDGDSIVISRSKRKIIIFNTDAQFPSHVTLRTQDILH